MITSYSGPKSLAHHTVEWLPALRKEKFELHLYCVYNFSSDGSSPEPYCVLRDVETWPSGRR
jgi:hypothetical protein